MKPITDISQLDFKKQYTYADYLTWRFEERVELIKGWLYKMSPSPKRFNQEISWRLERSFDNYLSKNPCKLYHAPFDVRLKKKQRSRS